MRYPTLSYLLLLVLPVYALAAPNPALPDHRLTPGAIRPSATAQEICSRRFHTGPYRHTTPKMKAEAYAEYHRTKKPGVCCEVDHLVPLELGGMDVEANLWAQPYKPVPGAHQKDLVENCMHRLVCEGKLGLAEAQRRLMTDWYAEYQREGNGAKCEP